jgi:phosphoglycerate dehydrogenase-like enzyme
MFDTAQFMELTADSVRPLEVALAEYEEGFVVRTAKANRLPREQLRQMSPRLGEDVRQTLQPAEIVQALDVPLDLLLLAPQLRWVQAIGAGIRHLYPEELAQEGIAVTSAAGVSAGPIAEFVMARVLEVFKNLTALRQSQVEHRWDPRTSSVLRGSTLGVVGFGAIGKAVAHLASAFGMNVLAVRRRPGAGVGDDHRVGRVTGPDGLDGLLEQSDVVVLAVPETTRTSKLIGKHEIELMKPNAVLCNVSRGSVVDEEELKKALRAGHLRAAILDVMDEEPLDAANELWQTPNTYVSSHCAGMYAGYATTFVELFASNVCRYARGDPLLNLVDPDQGY